MSFSRLGFLISHLFCNAIPHREVHFRTLQIGSVEEALRPRNNTILQETALKKKLDQISYAESVIWHFSKRSVEEVLRPRSNTVLQKTTFFSKKRFCFCFLRLVGFCKGYINASLDLEPVWEARFCTVEYVNQFAKIFGICTISQRRYSCFLGSLRRSVLRYP